MSNKQRALAGVMLGLAFGPVNASSQDDDLFDLSIEELVNLEVTSVSRKAESLSDTASAVYVITKADIRRHGIRSIPEALRLAPGVSANQVDGNKWAVGARGFSGRFSNKLLVLMDGRQLYTPSFSGVYWDEQNILIEEVERIEVIRGPGAVVWGTNAVNGVINIITSTAGSVDKSLVTAGMSPQGGNYLGIQHETELRGGGAVRYFGYYEDGEPHSVTATGEENGDDWKMLKLGTRADRTLENGRFSLSAHVYDGESGGRVLLSSVTPPFETQQDSAAEISGGFVRSSWSFESSNGASTDFQFYVDYSDRADPLVYSEERMTITGDFQRRKQYGRHEIIYGAAFRYVDFDFEGSNKIQFVSDADGNNVFSAFVQDEFSLSDSLTLTFGLKLENNDLSPNSVEWMPSVRGVWRYAEDHSFWAAATRAVRSPSIADTAVRILDLEPVLLPLTAENPFPLPARTGTLATGDFDSEVAVNLEAGFRGSLSSNVSYDVSFFAVDYDKLRSIQLGPVLCAPSETPIDLDPTCLFTSTNLIGLGVFTNNDTGYSRGGEVAVDWQAAKNLRLRSSISIANHDQETTDPIGLRQPSYYPDRQASLRALWSANEDLSVALWLRYTDELGSRRAEEYWQANLNVNWQPNDRTRVSVGGRNLLEDQNQEYRTDIRDIVSSAIDRTLFVNFTVDF